MINEFEVNQFLGNHPTSRKYYVYRLVDPRNLQTFYVGKGCGNRVFQHVNEAKKLIGQDMDEDEVSLKIQLISDILAEGKEVIAVIHRRGLTEHEAFEVEAALIDAYPGLTNIQRGHGNERGVISLKDLMTVLNTVEYTEPKDNYIIIKTSPTAINNNGSLYEATRRAWRAKLTTAMHYNYVLACVYGIVREVYKVEKWFQYSDTRIAFEGSPTNDSISQLKGFKIPSYYRVKGAANPFVYKKK
mgnify:CR=1 FL=1